MNPSDITHILFESKPKPTVAVDFAFGSIVFLRIRRDRKEGMVTELNVCPTGTLYVIGWDDGTTGRHYAMELTAEFEQRF